MSPRTLPVTPAERACATVLRAWLEWPGMADENATAQHTMSAVTRMLHERGWAEAGHASPAGAALLARVEAAERTPETVLRAMLAAYEADAIEKARAYYAGPGVDAALLRATNEADEAVTVVRDGLAILLAKEFTTLAGSMSTIGDDYAARLAGTTPIDAPPASPERPAYTRAVALIDALNKDAGGAVVNGALHAAIIAEANAKDAAPPAKELARTRRMLAPCVCGVDKAEHPRRACEGFHPVGGRECPGCLTRTYRADGIAHCTDCDPAKEPR